MCAGEVSLFYLLCVCVSDKIIFSDARAIHLWRVEQWNTHYYEPQVMKRIALSEKDVLGAFLF
jgi:hypothetical protein